MSRTYRRRHTTKNGMWTDLEYYTSNWTYPFADDGEWWPTARVQVPFPKDSAEYRKGKAIFHSDAATTNFKEPGPSWFRRMFTERPMRRYNKNEIRKWMNNPEYEPIVYDMMPLEYWT